MMLVALENQLELAIPGRGWDVPYIELLVEPLSMLIPNADSIDSTTPEVTSLIANIGVI